MLMLMNDDRLKSRVMTRQQCFDGMNETLFFFRCTKSNVQPNVIQSFNGRKFVNFASGEIGQYVLNGLRRYMNNARVHLMLLSNCSAIVVSVYCDFLIRVGDVHSHLGHPIRYVNVSCDGPQHAHTRTITQMQGE